MAELIQARVLYIASDNSSADVFKNAIEPCGHLVDVATSGAAGLARYDASPYDAIAISNQLPDLTAVDVAQQLLARDPGLAITLLADVGSEALIAEAVSIGVLNYAIRDKQSNYAELLPSLIFQSLHRGPRSDHRGSVLAGLDGRRLADAARLAKLGFWIWDEIEDRAIYCSDELANIHGVSVGEYLSRATSLEGGVSLVHPEDQARYQQLVEGTVDKSGGYEVEFRVIASDGTVKHVAERAEAETRIDGRLSQSFGIVQDITQLVEMQEALRESEARHQRAARIAKLGHWAWNEIEHKAIYGSEEYVSFFDMTVEDYMKNASNYEGLMLLVHPDDRQRYRDIMHTAEKAESGYEIDFRIQLQDGQIRHLREIAEAVLDDEGRLSQTKGTTIDISEQVAFEATLAERDTQIEQAIRVADMANWIWDDVNSKYLYVSPRMAYIYNSTPEAVKAGVFVIEDPLLMAHPDDLEVTRQALIDGDRTREPYQIEYRIIWDDGSIHTIRDSITPDFDEDGKHVRSIGCTQDISSFVEAQEELYKAQLNYRWAAEIGKLGHYVWDEVSNSCEHCSDELANMFDMTSEEYMEISHDFDLYLDHVCHPGDQDRYRRYLLDSKTTGSDIDISYRIFRSDGEIRYVHKFGRRIRNSEGVVVKTLGIVRDVTTEKVAEQALLDARNEAESASRLKSEFLAHMSHELRTPLNAITGFAQIMEEQTFGELGNVKYREYAGDISRSGNHLLNVINDILDLSKIEAEQIKLDAATFDVESAIAKCVHMISDHHSIQSKCRIRIDLPAKTAPLHADERIFSQIVLNLLSNANKFTPDDGSISVSVDYDENFATRIRVRDTGTGIAPADIDKVLEPFGQARSNSHLAHEGTGLGLPLSQKLMELHGGTLSLESELGVGTTVTLVFPPDRTM